MISLMEAYEADIAAGFIKNDSRQRLVLSHFQRLTDELKPRRLALLRGLSKKTSQGIYLYGPVGVGKTYLLDLFYEQLKLRKKSRYHFHAFMQFVDEQLRKLQGQPDPLKKIAAEFCKNTHVLCLDEFIVEDIADAMILAQLLQALFSHGLVLLATSNTPPEDLYWEGLQRPRFLPAIELLEKNCEILSFTEPNDYRLGRTSSLKAYHYPLNAASEESMQKQFKALTARAEKESEIQVQNRTIRCIQCAENCVWFDFQVLCNIPRSQLDYLEIADRFDTIFLSNIPKLGSDDTAQVVLLINLIDILYDKQIRLIISAETPLDALYNNGSMLQNFQRTLSRLKEMQSLDYLERSY